MGLNPSKSNLPKVQWRDQVRNDLEDGRLEHIRAQQFKVNGGKTGTMTDPNSPELLPSMVPSGWSHIGHNRYKNDDFEVVISHLGDEVALLPPQRPVVAINLKNAIHRLATAIWLMVHAHDILYELDRAEKVDYTRPK